MQFLQAHQDTVVCILVQPYKYNAIIIVKLVKANWYKSRINKSLFGAILCFTEEFIVGLQLFLIFLASQKRMGIDGKLCITCWV